MIDFKLEQEWEQDLNFEFGKFLTVQKYDTIPDHLIQEMVSNIIPLECHLTTIILMRNKDHKLFAPAFF